VDSWAKQIGKVKANIIRVAIVDAAKVLFFILGHFDLLLYYCFYYCSAILQYFGAGADFC
jgi:hypothetical protein